MGEIISTKPWGNFTRAMYSLEQLRAATLIHPPQPTNRKEDYKLRVREPSGALNRNAIFAAASVLAGGRGGVDATSEQKASAATKLISLYGIIKHSPPPSLKAMAHTDSPNDALAHFGVKGMRWGVHRSRDISVGGQTRPRVSGDVQRVTDIQKVVKKGGTKAISNKELQDLVTRMNLEQQYSRLTQKPSRLKQGLAFANTLFSAGNTVNQAMQFSGSPAGKALAEQFKIVKKVVTSK